MSLRSTSVLGVLVSLSLHSAVSASHFEVQFVERVGNTDINLGQQTTFLPGTSHRVRVQVGVFSDAQGEAPAGGLLGWNFGTISTSGGGTFSRSPGRLAPFNFLNGPTSNGTPTSDPFSALTGIDATLGVQTIAWPLGGDGQPVPRPAAVIRGRNEFVSLYEITVGVGANQSSPILIDLGGHLVAAQDWRVLQENPPVPGGPDGSVSYVPLAGSPSEFNSRLAILVPAPSALGAVGLMGLMGLRRRR